MSFFSDGLRSVVKAATASGPAEARFRAGLEKAHQHYRLGCEYQNDADLSKSKQILGQLSSDGIYDCLLLYARHKLTAQICIKQIECVVLEFRKGVSRAASKPSAESGKSADVLTSELKSVNDMLSQKELHLGHLMRQPFSHKNNEDVLRCKQEIQRVKARKSGLEEAVMLAQSRGAERHVLTDSSIDKVKTLLKDAFDNLVALTHLQDFPPSMDDDRTQTIVEGKEEIDRLKKEIKSLLKG